MQECFRWLIQIYGYPGSITHTIQKAFDNIVIPIDLLEYFYAQFLFEIGEKEKGMEYLKKAIDKGEPEAIKLMNTINTTR